MSGNYKNNVTIFENITTLHIICRRSTYIVIFTRLIANSNTFVRYINRKIES